MWTKAAIVAASFVALQAVAGVMYLVQGDWRRGVIWICYAIAGGLITMEG